MNDTPLRRLSVSPGLTLEFRDKSNRYYGDYHRILIEVDVFVDTAEGVVRFRNQRPLKKMGVGSVDVAFVTESLIDQFLATTNTYMTTIDFAQKLLLSTKRPGQKLWKLIA